MWNRPSQIMCRVMTVHLTSTQTVLPMHEHLCTILNSLYKNNLNISMCSSFFWPMLCSLFLSLIVFSCFTVSFPLFLLGGQPSVLNFEKGGGRGWGQKKMNPWGVLNSLCHRYLSWKRGGLVFPKYWNYRGFLSAWWDLLIF